MKFQVKLESLYKRETDKLNLSLWMMLILVRLLFPCCRVSDLSPSSVPQGISIRPLIEYINVRRTNRNLDTINVEVHCRVSSGLKLL